MRTNPNAIFLVGALSLCLFAISTRAQFAIPSDGSDGDFARPVSQTDIVINLADAVTGAWDAASSAENAGKGIYDRDKWAVVFKYNSVTIRSNQVVSFKNHPSGAPVVWLVKGDVRIAGILNLSGKFNAEAFRWEPGPGGFRPAYSDAKIGQAGYGGFGPGGSYSREEYGIYGSARDVRLPYGNSQIIPLVGGSGAGYGDASNWRSTAAAQDSGGGGAILLACGGEVFLDGSILAQDEYDPFGANTDPHYGGSGGAIRIVAARVNGNGSVEARSYESSSLWGRVRIETPIYVGGLHVFPETAVVSPTSPPLIWPKPNSPTVRIVSVAGRTAPGDPLSSLEANPPPDLSFQDDQSVDIVIETTNLGPSSVVKVRVTPKLSGDAFDVLAVFDSGDTTRASWIATTKFARGYAALQVRAVGP